MTFGPFRLDPISGRLYRGAPSFRLRRRRSHCWHTWPPIPAPLHRTGAARRALAGVFVGDAVLKAAIRDIRKALGDTAQAPLYIETAHRRGYRFHISDPVHATASVPAPADRPRVQYARSGSVNIAYQVVGSSPVDLVFVMGWVSHLEFFWNEPAFARFLRGLSSMARLILLAGRRGAARRRPRVAHHCGPRAGIGAALRRAGHSPIRTDRPRHRGHGASPDALKPVC